MGVLPAGFLSLTQRLKATAGVRADRFDATGRTAVSPRFGLSYAFRDGTAVHVSYGIYNQAPETFWINCDPSNRSLSYLRTESAVLGFSSILRSNIRLTAEVFGKSYSYYPVDKANPYQTLANLGGSVIPTYFGSPLLSAGKGFARGIELAIQKLRRNRWSWSASYSYSTVKFQALDGVLRAGISIIVIWPTQWHPAGSPRPGTFPSAGASRAGSPTRRSI